MPHLVLNYTSNIDPGVDFRELFLKLHTMLNTEVGIEIDSCKSRVQKWNTYYIAHGETGKAFVHLEIDIFEGRPAETIKLIGDQSLRIIREFFTASPKQVETQVTVEIKEINKGLYFKYTDRSLP
jgi:5-carboxymethyl-2-hydroxymuconate isomerase